MSLHSIDNGKDLNNHFNDYSSTTQFKATLHGIINAVALRMNEVSVALYARCHCEPVRRGNLYEVSLREGRVLCSNPCAVPLRTNEVSVAISTQCHYKKIVSCVTVPVWCHCEPVGRGNLVFKDLYKGLSTLY